MHKLEVFYFFLTRQLEESSGFEWNVSFGRFSFRLSEIHVLCLLNLTLGILQDSWSLGLELETEKECVICPSSILLVPLDGISPPEPPRLLHLNQE